MLADALSFSTNARGCCSMAIWNVLPFARPSPPPSVAPPLPPPSCAASPRVGNRPAPPPPVGSIPLPRVSLAQAQAHNVPVHLPEALHQRPHGAVALTHRRGEAVPPAT